MSVRGKMSAVCQALLLAASVTALSAGAAHAQPADDLSDLGNRVLENPQDVSLNLQYAHAAEAAGKPRLALVAYERILINDPTNADARAGYERLRRQIEPGYTVTRLQVGARWDSNAADVNDDFFFQPRPEESLTYYGRLMIANESHLLGHRWRSILNLSYEDNQDLDYLDYGFVGAQTGPIFYAGPHMAVIPAVGGGVAWLGGDKYFTEYNLGLTLEGRAAGASYWARLRAGHREYDPHFDFFFNPQSILEDGNYVEVQAGVTKPRVFSDRDTVTVEPFIRYSDIKGDVFDFYTFDFMGPGQFTEYGVDVNYNYQLTDHLQASVGALARKRDFTSSSRADTYLSPQVSVTLQRALPCDCDVRLQYRYRDNNSNEDLSDYHADQVSLQLTTRF